MADEPQRLILVTGASGYVGGRLVRLLTDRGERLRCLARFPPNLRGRVPAGVEVVAGDVMDRESLDRALAGVTAAYYLVHSMASGQDFEEMERAGAHNFGETARAAGLRRIIYLGGLGDSAEELSPHLRSRQRVGAILRASGVQTIEFRASIVIGSGSLSFEMIRALTERLPVMVTPRWVSVKAQPIAIGDLLDYLAAALDVEVEASPVFEIGGSDRVSYGDLMKEFAQQRGLRRLMIPVPVLSPRLSSLWLGLVTPLYARVGKILVESLRHETLVRDDSALRVFGIEPRGVRQALAEALVNEDREFAETKWSDAISSSGFRPRQTTLRFGNRIFDIRERRVRVPPPAAFAPVRRIGGGTGWYYANGLWRLRGLLDRLVGGVGLRRGRKDPEQLRVGDALDWWRVEAFEPDRRLRLVAEMRLPGRAWLEFEVRATDDGALIRQIAIFDPLGIWGLLYWYLVLPVHVLVFRGMLRGICRRAETEAP